MKPQRDTKPGNYYVTIHDGGRYAFLAGPFRDNHQAALDLVSRCREIAEDLDPWAHFYAFGTARIDYDYDKPGKLNARLGLASVCTSPGCANSCAEITPTASAEETNNAVSAETTHTEKVCAR